jgi:microcystin-dependent protein
MKYGDVDYMWQATENEWRDVVQTWPRENLEKLTYDFAFSSGVLSSFELIQAVAPNLTITVKAGRACYRDANTRKAKIIELGADTPLNLSGFIPVSATPVTLLIVAEPKQESALSVTVTNAPPGSESYDPAFTGATFDRLIFDGAIIKAVGAVSGEEVILGSVVLSSGQTQILTSHIKAQNNPSSPRQIASPSPELTKLREEITQLKTRVEPVGKIGQWAGEINQIPSGYALCDGRALSRGDYAELFALLTTTFGTGDGINTFNIPDLRDRFIIGAGSSYTRNSQGGANEIALSVAQLPSHDHPVSIDGVADHDHGVMVSNSGNHRHTFTGSQGTTGGGAGVFPIADNGTGSVVPYDAPSPYGVLDGGNHTHTVDVQPGGSHSHGADVGNTGSNQAHENRPPYVGLFQIIRVL